MPKLILASIRLYQKHFPKPDPGCRFSPTCSQYTYQAVAKYGILHGGLLGVKRILHCHPWSPGGFDPLK